MKRVDNKQKYSLLIKTMYKAIFSLPNEDLLIHYEEVKKELEKRGVFTNELR